MDSMENERQIQEYFKGSGITCKDLSKVDVELLFIFIETLTGHKNLKRKIICSKKLGLQFAWLKTKNGLTLFRIEEHNFVHTTIDDPKIVEVFKRWCEIIKYDIEKEKNRHDN